MAFNLKKTSGKGLTGLLMRGGCMLILFFLLFPLLVIVGTSFTETDYLAFPPKGLTLKWYKVFLQDPTYIEAIRLSFVLAFFASLLSAIVGTAAALALVRHRFLGRSFLSSLFLSPLILPQVVTGAAILQLLGALGIVRTFLGFILGHAIITFPYIIRTVIATLEGYDMSLEEAAQDLGARRLNTFFLITLPLVKPGVIAGILFAFIISWTNVEVSMFLTTSAMMPVPMKIFNYIEYNVDPMIAAVSATTIYLSFIVIMAIDLSVGLEKFSGAK